MTDGSDDGPTGEDAPAPRLLARPELRRFVVARFSLGLAMQTWEVGIGWWLYSITGSALALGLVGLCVFLPALLLALPAGEVIDRFDRRRIVAAAYVTMAFCAVAMFVLVLLDLRDPRPIYGLAMLIGAARVFAMPGLQALLPTLVPRPILSNAVALATSTHQVAVIVGPAVGGLLYAVGPAVVFATALLGFATAITAISGLPARPPAPREKPTAASLFAGVAFIRSRPSLLGAISLDLFAVLLGGATALLPIYARDILQTGPWGLGLLRSAPAVGAALTGLFLARRPLGGNCGHRMFAAVVVFGLATIVFGLSGRIEVSLVALAVLGSADMVSMVIRQTLVQHDTPDEMRGRVSAVNSIFIGASNELGQFESGALAAAIGPVGSVVLGGIGTIVVAGLWMRWFPALFARDRLVEPATDAASQTGAP